MADNQKRLTSADLAVVVFAMVLPSLVTWLYFIALDGAAEWLQKGAAVTGKAIQFGLPLVWVCLVRRQRLQLSWPTKNGLAMGILFGLAVAAALAVLYFTVLKHSAGWEVPAKAIRAKIESLGLASPLKYFVLGCFYTVIHSFLEEYYWRWFVFGQLTRWVNLPAAIIVSSAGFAAHHVLVLAHFFGYASPWTWLGSASVMIGGAFWAWLLRRTGSLYANWLSHAIVDAAIFAVGFDLLPK